MKQIPFWVKKLSRSRISYFLIIFSILFPLIISGKTLLSDQLAFWFDPARDFLAAVANIKKLSLLGPPTGIPGVFYGPYWIWMISLGLLISKDPRIVTLFITTLPYLIIFPFVLYRLKSIIGSYFWFVIWLLFYYIYNGYINSLWNPNIAPLLTIVLLLLIFRSNLKKRGEYLFLGIVAGLIANFHFSFGIGIIFAVAIFISVSLLVKIFTKNKTERLHLKDFLIVIFYISGIIIAFAPTILFETRHGFMQIKSIYTTLSNAVLYNVSPVGQTGLTGAQIILVLFERLTKYFIFKRFEVVLIPVLLEIIWRIYKKHLKFTPDEVKMLFFALLSIVTPLIIYLKSTNPVWEYHFIAVEVLFLLLLAIISNKLLTVKILVIIQVVYLTFTNMQDLVRTDQANWLKLPSLSTKKYIVNLVYQDALNKPYTVFIYSSAIYTYDYDYLFNWIGSSRYGYLPDKVVKSGQSVYLVIPATSLEVKEDFINYKTPKQNFKTDREWQIPDGTTIIKRADRTIPKL